MNRPVFELEFTAAAEHIDELGHVNNAVWVQWIQDVALAHWYSIADPAHQDDYIWVVVRHEIDYLRAAFEGEALTGRTWVGEAPKGARFDRHMEFIGADGKEYGPATVEQIRTWIGDGRANLDTQARRTGEDQWRRLGDYPEFSSTGEPQPPPTGSVPVAAAGPTASSTSAIDANDREHGVRK